MRITSTAISDNTSALYNLGGCIGRIQNAGPVARARIEVDLDHEDLEVVAREDVFAREYRLVPKDASDLGFALFALDHAGDDKVAAELARLRPGLEELWAEAAPETRLSYNDRAKKLQALTGKR